MWEVFPLQDLPYQHIVIDLPGHGQSPLGKLEASIEAIANEISHLLDLLGLDTVDIIGHSLGGYVALEIAKIRNNGGKICLFHSTFWQDSPQKKQDRDRVIQVVRHNKNLFLKEAIPNLFLDADKHPEAVRQLLQEALQMDAEAIAFYAAVMRDRQNNENLALKLGKNLYVIQGDADKMIASERMMTYAESITILVLENAGHMSHIEQQQHSWAAIQKVLSI